MPYLNLDLNYFDHPKTIQLAIELGGHRSEVLPIRLWAHIGKYHSEDGFLRGYTAPAIARVLNWKENPEKLVEAMLKVGFLAKRKDGFAVPSWNEHSGHLAVFKERAKIAAQARWSKTKPASPNGNGHKEPTKKNPEKTGNAGLSFTEEQMREIRITLAKRDNCAVFSEACEIAYKELMERIRKAVARKKIENPFAYAMTAAKNGAL